MVRSKGMKKALWVVLGVLLAGSMLACNHGMSSYDKSEGKKQSKRDRSQRTVIDSAEYIDFTIVQYNAGMVRKEDLLFTLGNMAFKNGNSTIKIKMREGAIEISSDCGFYNGKENCQIYGVFPFDVKAASSDCLYIRKSQSGEGYIMIDGVLFKNDAVPDLAACLPLYGYSRNRIEVSPVMNGYIIMPSGTYWKQ